MGDTSERACRPDPGGRQARRHGLSAASRVTVRSDFLGQTFITAAVPAAAPPTAATEAIYQCVGELLRQHELVVVYERVLGSLAVREGVLRTRRQTLRDAGLPTDGPLTWFDGAPPAGAGLAGVHIRAVPRGYAAARLPNGPVGDRSAGFGWHVPGVGRFVSLQNVDGLPPDGAGDASHAAQVERALGRVAARLEAVGVAFENVVRTWYYLADITAWYAEFNAARNRSYARHGLLSTAAGPRLPASTGVGGRNPAGAAVVADVLAFVPDAPDRTPVERMENPSQFPAWKYGAAFARGVALHAAGSTFIEVSGTAAVGADGQSLHPGDGPAQVEVTLDLVATLLAQRGGRLDQIAAATAYVRRPQDQQHLRTALCRRGRESLPLVCAVADICRPELLFELEAQAILST